MCVCLCVFVCERESGRVCFDVSLLCQMHWEFVGAGAGTPVYAHSHAHRSKGVKLVGGLSKVIMSVCHSHRIGIELPMPGLLSSIRF